MDKAKKFTIRRIISILKRLDSETLGEVERLIRMWLISRA